MGSNRSVQENLQAGAKEFGAGCKSVLIQMRNSSLKMKESRRQDRICSLELERIEISAENGET